MVTYAVGAEDDDAAFRAFFGVKGFLAHEGGYLLVFNKNAFIRFQQVRVRKLWAGKSHLI